LSRSSIYSAGDRKTVFTSELLTGRGVAAGEEVDTLKLCDMELELVSPWKGIGAVSSRDGEGRARAAEEEVADDGEKRLGRALRLLTELRRGESEACGV